jgi:UDP-N-acetylmuramoyl-L-alanyl-D-glutamate--2,6-diaminopimelate ligase
LKKLQYILSNIQTIATIGNLDIPIQEICIDSRKANQYSLFVAIKGTHLDSHQFIEDVIEKGIVAIVCQQLPNKIHENVAYILVEDTSFTLGFISSNFFDEPSTKLKVIGITGTNGKTTCATLAYQLFTSLGFTCGLISTVENIIGTEKFPATHTTPDAISLQQLLHQMVESKCEYVFMEVSSHAIHQHRIAGLHFAGACFTNITHEHLDYHGTFEEYIRVKKILFRWS